MNGVNLDNPTGLYNELLEAGYKRFINKKELSEIMGCSIATINNYIKKSYGLPNYIKLGNNKQSKVIFKLKDVVEYLENQKIQMA